MICIYIKLHRKTITVFKINSDNHGNIKNNSSKNNNHNDNNDEKNDNHVYIYILYVHDDIS